MRIGLITDIHFPVDDDSGIGLGTATDILAGMAFFCSNRVDFVLQLGDLIKGTDSRAHEELRQVVPMLNKYQGRIRHVIGNHCMAVPRKELLRELGLPFPYYSFTAECFRFLVLDGMDVSIRNEPETGADRKLLRSCLEQPELHDYCGAIGERQMEWITSELLNAGTNGEQVIATCHFPLHPATSDMKHGLLWNHREVRELLSAYPAVKACIGGHYHYGGYTKENGLHFLVLPAFVNRAEHPESAWAVAELQNKRLVVTGVEGVILYDLELEQTMFP
ncbi:MAG: metallophosphoesterase [Chlorobium limicola]|nr:metallophosphoesterase [Chlorobium limicola]